MKNNNNAFPNGKGHISYSELNDWLECSYRHKLKHIDGIALDSGSIHTAFGTAVHDSIEQFLSTKNLPKPEDAIKQFQTLVSELDADAKEKALDGMGEFEENLPDMIGQVPDWLDEAFPGWKPISAEHRLYEEIENQPNVKFKGFIDAVIKIPKKKTKKVLRLNELKGETASEEYAYWILDWKGQRLSAPILTPKGWTTMGELKINQSIVASNGKSCKVTGIFPLGKREVYRITLRDGSFTDVTDDHLWRVYRSDNYSKVLSTKELINEKKYVFLPVLSSPVVFEEKQNFSIDPYVLGLLLGDGTFRSSSLYFTSCDQELIEELIRLSPSHWEKGYINCDQRAPSQLIKGGKKDIKILGLDNLKSHEKKIPKKYLFGDISQRLSLIQGLLDTDGWVQKGVAKFSTTSKQMALDLKHLVNSLGGVAFISTRKKQRKISNHIENIVTVRLPKGMKPFRLQRKLEKWNSDPCHRLRRKISKIEKIGEDEMQCISVDAEDSLYVTEDFILTHNTCSWGWKADQKRKYEKQLQLILYKYFYCLYAGLPVKDTRCGFVLIKRIPKKTRTPGDRIELVPVSVGPKAIEKGLKSMHNMLNQVRQGRALKNRRYCQPFCPFKNTEFCR